MASTPIPRPARPLSVSLLIIGFFAVSLACSTLSRGVYHEDDLTHYLFARWCKEDPRYLLDAWGRPGFTIPYALPAMIGSAETGLYACRVFSAILAAATAWLVYDIARRLGIRHAWAAIPLLYLQPLFARLGMTTLTELPLACYLALATWLLVRNQLGFSVAIVALAPITRDESIILLPIWAAAMWRLNAKGWTYPLLLWAIIAHNVASGLLLNYLPAARWLQPAVESIYGSGTPLTFVPKILQACGPAIVALAAIGGWRLVVSSQHRGHRQLYHRQICIWLIVIAPLAWWAAQTAIYMRGAYASGGYSRFLVPMSPWLAILAAAGARLILVRRPIRAYGLGWMLAIVIGLWCAAEVEFRWRPPLVPDHLRDWAAWGRWLATAACLPFAILAWRLLSARRDQALRVSTGIAAITACGLLAAGVIGWRPMHLTSTQLSARELAPVVQRLAGEGRPILALNRWIHYWADLSSPWTAAHDGWSMLESAQPGAVFAWDRRFCREQTPALTYAEMKAQPGWQLLWPTDTDPDGKRVTGEPFVALFERPLIMEASR